MNPSQISKKFNIDLVVELQPTIPEWMQIILPWCVKGQLVEPKQPTWWYWCLAMQGHPSNNLKLSKTAYAASGWSSDRINREGCTWEMRNDRLKHTRKLIKFFARDGVKETFNIYYEKFTSEWDDIGVVRESVDGYLYIDIEYDF
jgi:hypothetical protein